MCFKMICSSSLRIVLVSEIGMKFERSDLLPELYIGVILAVFHSLGRVHDDRDLLKLRNPLVISTQVCVTNVIMPRSLLSV